MVTALGIARPGGAIGRVGVPAARHDPRRRHRLLEERRAWPAAPPPSRAYIDELLPDVLEGRIEPGRVFDRTGTLDEVPDGYRAMNDREVAQVPDRLLRKKMGSPPLVSR